MYICPICRDTFLFQPQVCPTCAVQGKKQRRSQRAKERRVNYDPTGHLSSSEFWQLLRWYPRCPCCGRGWEQIPEPISQDHIIPISRGGSNTVANLQPLCQPCNLWKRDHLIAFNPQAPGYPTALPQRLLTHFQHMGEYQPPPPPCQLELLPLESGEPEAVCYPHNSPACLERATIQLTWALLDTGCHSTPGSYPRYKP